MKSFKYMAALIAVMLVAGATLATSMQFFCVVSMSDAKYENGGYILHAKVGQHFESKIWYQIGWTVPPPHGGYVKIEKQAIKAPMYMFFLEGDSPRSAGFHLDNTGSMNGTPTIAGRWEFDPAVRDSLLPTYEGTGIWMGTDTITSNDDKTVWYETSKPVILIVEQ